MIENGANENGDLEAFLVEPELRKLIEFGRRLSETKSCSRSPSRQLNPESQLGPGSQLGRYVLEEPIGGGGFGLVYRATDPTLNREVVIKVQRAPALATGLDEARTAALLNHPHVVPVHDVVELPGNSWAMVMPYIDGETIKHTGNVEQMIALLLQAAGALAHIHASGYLHQDIKPGNILVDRNGHVLLCDFGLAANAQDEGRCDAGSPPYLSPEQIRSGTADHRSDVWSFGVVIYELLTGERPFTGSSRKELYKAICDGNPPDIHSLNPKVPRKVSKLCNICLQKRPERRFASAVALYRELGHVIETRTSKRRKRVLLTVGFSALLLLSCLTWMFTQWGAAVSVREFLASDDVHAYSLFSSLGESGRVDRILLQAANSSDRDSTYRAALAIAARRADAAQVVDSLQFLPKRDEQFFLDIVSVNPQHYLTCLIPLLHSDSSELRTKAIGFVLLIAPEDTTLGQVLDDQRSRAEFLSSVGDWSRHEDRLLKIASSTNQNSVQATLLSIVGKQEFGSQHSKVIKTVSEIRDRAQTPEIHSLCNWICGLPVKSPAAFPSNFWKTGPAGIHLIRISIDQQDYWVADCETSLQLFTTVNSRSLENPGSLVRPEKPKSSPPDELLREHPIAQVSWYEAIRWCNCLSELEGLAPCYVQTSQVEELHSTVNGQVKVSSQFKWDYHPENSGYRLPAVAEWPALAGGNAGRNLVLDDEEPLRLFANFGTTSSAPCRTYLPNKAGLFDTRGNVGEWCWDQSESKIKILHGEESLVVPVTSRAAMGGSYVSDASRCDPDVPLWIHPESHYPMIGFRVMRRVD
ncbi:MAG: bifunctional serine/threonine-protein kinase/formylglycine-generating enzyme family protein [Pirellulaceae bacterium]